MRKIVYDWGQIISGLTVSVGVIVEVIYRADIGFVLVTMGGLFWGIMTKLKGE